MDFSFQFSPEDPEARAFFQDLGLTDSQINSGYLTDSDLTENNINPYMVREAVWSGLVAPDRSAEALAELFALLFNVKPELEIAVAPNMGRAALDLLKGYSPKKRHALFNNEFCSEPTTAKLIFENEVENNSIFPGLTDEYAYEVTTGVLVEKKCSPEILKQNDVLMDELRGVHFEADLMPDVIRKSSEAVVKIVSLNGAVAHEQKLLMGSAIIVSPLGHVITANHVLYDDDGFFNVSNDLMYHGGHYAITERDVVYHNADNDIAVVRLPELGRVPDLDHVTLREDPLAHGEPLRAIGFPNMQNPEENFSRDRPTVTSGRYEGLHAMSVSEDVLMPDVPDFDSRDHLFYKTTVGIVFGNSGGGYFDESGRLVGVASSMLYGELVDDYTFPSFAAALLPSDVESGVLANALADIREVQTDSQRSQSTSKSRRSFFFDGLKTFFGFGSGETQ